MSVTHSVSEFTKLVHWFLPGTSVQVVTKDRHEPTSEVLAAVIRFDFGDEISVAELHGLLQRLGEHFPGVGMVVKPGLVRDPDAPDDEDFDQRSVGCLVVDVTWPRH